MFNYFATGAPLEFDRVRFNGRPSNVFLIFFWTRVKCTLKTLNVILELGRKFLQALANSHVYPPGVNCSDASCSSATNYTNPVDYSGGNCVSWVYFPWWRQRRTGLPRPGVWSGSKRCQPALHGNFQLLSHFNTGWLEYSGRQYRGTCGKMVLCEKPKLWHCDRHHSARYNSKSLRYKILCSPVLWQLQALKN